MFVLTEKQRTDAIAACERIEELARRQQITCENIRRIFDNMAKGRPADDGLTPLPPISGRPS